MAAIGKADHQRWSSPDGLEAWWEARTRVIAQLIPPGSSVIEFGAGRRQLEKYLVDASRYTPSDLVDRGPGTLVCDLNERPLPDLSLSMPSVAVFGGVLEYVKNVDSLVSWLGAQGIRTCVASFDAVPSGLGPYGRARHRLRRRYYGYMNNLTEASLVQTFEAAGLMCVERRTWTSQGIYRFEKPVVGLVEASDCDRVATGVGT
jgi:hypothetical protein